MRHDIQMLADAGVIAAPVTTWPLSWADVAQGFQAGAAPVGGSPQLLAAYQRINRRIAWEQRDNELHVGARTAVAEDPRQLRTFEASARETKELEASLSWMGERFALRLQGQVVEDDDGNTDYRQDGTYVGMALGNTMLSAGWLDRWWGPGWEGSLAYSNNARPIPTVALERNLARPFEWKWLRWLGPWKAILTFGKLEHDREVPDANLIGFRFAARPLPELEVAITRTAQWCGDDRPCDLDSFWDLLIGKSNTGEGGINRENEPGNQLGGFDLRWRSPLGDWPYAVYAQGYAEDELDNRPSEWMIQYGLEGWSSLPWGDLSLRWHLEASNTAVATRLKNASRWVSQRYDIAYNNAIYRSGYRFRGRTIGHAMDNDGRMVSLGGLAVESDGDSWQVLLRYVDVNRDGDPDPRHSISATPQEIWNLELGHRRDTRWGQLDFRLGLTHTDDESTGQTDTDADVAVQWSIELGRR